MYRNSIPDDKLREWLRSQTDCMICGRKEKLVVDHDHNSGKVRGLLCNHCNRGLGHFRDDPEVMAIAIEYINNRKQ